MKQMKRSGGCLVASSAAFLAFFVFVYGLHPWFSPGITTRKLAVPNPTSYVFDASVAEIHAVLKKRAVRCCGKAIEFKDNALFSGSILRSPGNENDAYIHNFHDPIGASAIYFAVGNPLPYICEFHLHITAINPRATRVVVVAQNPEVIRGLSWWGLHGSPANIYKSVEPTTIEEYRILLELGSSLTAADMPQLAMPTTE
jgi:hypothetical protein